MIEEIQYLLCPFGINLSAFKKLEGYNSLNYKVTDNHGQSYVLKHYKNESELKFIQEEMAFVDSIKDELDYEISHTLLKNGIRIYHYEDGSFSRLLPFIEGTFLAHAEKSPELLQNLGKAMGQMVNALKPFNSIHFARKRHSWDLQFALQNKALLSYVLNPQRKKLVQYFFDQFEHITVPVLSNLPRQLIHNDFNEWNILCDANSVSGVIDFGDATVAPVVCELAIGISYIMMIHEMPIAAACEIIKGFCTLRSLTRKEVKILPQLIVMRAITSVIHSAKAKSESSDTEYILISEKGAWDLIEKWIQWNPIFIENAFLKAAGFGPHKDVLSKGKVENLRKNLFSSALSLSYDIPIHMSSAAFQFMYDAKGNTYLDAYNNIPIVGHSHPNISEAASRQIRKLNTNTRYHTDSLYRYAEKLLSHFPKQLSKVFFVNSGTEANELAQRIATNYTQKKSQIVMEMGYHGHTNHLINLSAYKYNGLGGKGKISSVCELPLPKEYNGKYSNKEEYLLEAKNIINEALSDGQNFSSLLVEPISGCGGQVPLIDGYLESLVPWLKEKNILCISDEVQIGFGRLGHWFWGFEMQKFTPDIVVLGKPMGNGFPLAAVVTTADIADAFDNGMEFFSSFGGNPIVTEVGLAVLKTIEEEGLQKNAKETGEYFKKQLNLLQKDFLTIGDVRGEGLFLGIEFITEEGDPNGALCKTVKNKLKDNFILTGSDGKHNEVLKMKPPLCFNHSNLDRVVEVLGRILKSEK